MSTSSAKGDHLGECNRAVCHTSGAFWYHTGNHRWYCQACAQLVNEFTPGTCTKGIPSPLAPEGSDDFTKSLYAGLAPKGQDWF
jgi:hypothetical protein